MILFFRWFLEYIGTLVLLPWKQQDIMGKGDRKSKKGKIWRDSYGNSRRKKALKAKLKRTTSKKAAVVVESDVAAKPKRAAAKKKSES